MRFIDLSCEDPAENIALEEALLDSVEAGSAPDTLRLWESPVPFVVIGSGQRIRETVNLAACQEDGVPVLRRCSAGGAVLQGPGCLNYSLFLRYESYPETADLHGSYAYILDRAAQALLALGAEACREGISDLVLEGRKVSGNAQRRKRRACLHHGTLLYMDHRRSMARYLPEPKDRPSYRGEKTHHEFVGMLLQQPECLRAELRRTFAPSAPPSDLLPEETRVMLKLAQEKYARAEWTHRR